MSPDDARPNLAARQQQLVAALVGDAQSGLGVPGVDPAHLAVAAQSLAAKRARGVKKSWPALTAALGDDFSALFEQFARATPLPAFGGSLVDGHEFCLWLEQHDRLDDASRLEWFRFELRFRRASHGLMRRRLPSIQFRRLPQSKRLLVGLRLSPRWEFVRLLRFWW